jgi:catechol 2,3-dioxygenase-like lactoylglutathione lyase family enzyme
MVSITKPRAIGFNHVALEVGDIEEALALYGRIFDFQLRGKSKTMAFIDLGDQFIALQAGRKQAADDGRHVGLVVDDKEAAPAALKSAGSRRSAVRFWISATLGAIASRSWAMTISSSPKLQTFCAAWASRN